MGRGSLCFRVQVRAKIQALAQWICLHGSVECYTRHRRARIQATEQRPRKVDGKRCAMRQKILQSIIKALHTATICIRTALEGNHHTQRLITQSLTRMMGSVCETTSTLMVSHTALTRTSGSDST